MKKARRHTLIIDRWIDADTASVELDGETIVAIPRALLPSRAVPDDVLRIERRTEAVEIAVDEEARKFARRGAARLAARLRKRDSGGDVVL